MPWVRLRTIVWLRSSQSLFLREICLPNIYEGVVKLIFTILLSYPFAGVLKRLPDAEPAKKNLFMIGYGTSLARMIGERDGR